MRTKAGKRLVGLTACLAGLAMASLLLGCRRSDSPQGAEATLRVGLLLPLTGEAAVYGEAIRQGFDLGQSRSTVSNRLTLSVEDDGSSASVGVTAFRKLAAEGVDIVVGGAQSSVASAIAPLANRDQIILLSPTASKPELTADLDYVFRVMPSDDYVGTFLADYAFNQRGYRALGVYYANVDYGVGIARTFRERFESLGGAIEVFRGYSEQETDFRPGLLRLSEAGIDAVFVPGYYKETALLLRQASELGLDLQFFGTDPLYEPELLRLAGKAAEGVFFSYPYYDPESTEAVTAEFVRAYQERHGEAPNAFAALGYDCFLVIEAALLAADLDIDRFREEFAKVEGLKGAAGPITFDSDGDVLKPFQVIQIHDGGFVQADGW